MSFDFATARTADTSTLTVVHPTQGELDTRIEVAGRDSDVYQEAFATLRRKVMELMAEDKLSKAKERELTARALAAITASWENVSYEGEPLECTPENAFKLYNDPGLKWLADQLDSFAEKRGNYLGN